MLPFLGSPRKIVSIIIEERAARDVTRYKCVLSLYVKIFFQIVRGNSSAA